MTSNTTPSQVESQLAPPGAASKPVLQEAPPFFRTLSSGALLVVVALVLGFLLGLGYLILGQVKKPGVEATNNRPLAPQPEAQILAQLSALEAQAKQLKAVQAEQDAQLPPALRVAAGEPTGGVQIQGAQPLQDYRTMPPPQGAGPRNESGAGLTPLQKARSAPLVPQGFRADANPQQGVASDPALARDPSAVPRPYPDPSTLADSILTRLSPPQGPSGAALGPASGSNDTTAQRQAFVADATRHEVRGYAQVLRPLATPYTLLQGTVLPAVLESALNSDLPGQTSALLRRNVYDSATGQHLLLPKGARLIGSYDSRVVFGERRILVAWDRLLLPSGSSVDLHGMPGVDGLRAAGLSQGVNNHLVQLFGNALLLSAISAGAQLSQPQQSSSSAVPSASQVAAAAVGQELSQVGTAVIQRQLNVKPTLTIAPGYLFNVELTADLSFGEPLSAQIQPGR